ncbi:hypothetical protein OG824_06275 [Streptomyces prunicolor]|uniref:hypothetical protein n=1 Tax=Streptomyces prunicolor TaxID=67348 RepID=UPI00224EC055|nr:hypothetical protein [Streptomyces prunicolor]MCX5234836.1 hypothetical protein [Streptomyces prunicolor]
MGMKGKVALGAVVGVVVIGVVSANAGGNGGDSGSGSSGKGSSASAEHKDAGKKSSDKKGSTEAVETKKAAFDGDGDFQVGTDIKPGTYRSSGNTDGMCYWERAKNASGDTDSLLANDNVSGASYVTIKSTDKIFKSSGCKDWEAVDAKAQGSPATKMAGDGGMFKVGVDIAPGTYKSTGNTDDMCYWERTKDAEQGLDSILANDNVTGTAVVTISAKDAYFKTTGCKDWKKTA